MTFFDMPIQMLETYQPEDQAPEDFDAFWQATLDAARQHPLNAQFTPVDVGMRLVETYDVSFSGYGGQTVKGWYLRPAGVADPLPCVVEYIGYGGGRGFPFDWLVYASAGFAYLLMDTRGQGSAWRRGVTPDLPDGANPFTPGFMTQGILDPHTYYYRRVFTDAVRAVEAARSRDDVDPARIAVTGGSQGGAISLAVAGLQPDVALCMADVPFLCDFRRAVGLVDTAPYNEIVRYLSIHHNAATVFSTLAYFDNIHFAPKIEARTLVSVGLMDTICPPSTVYGAYNRITAQKAMKVYTFNNHEGGASAHTQEKLSLLHEMWG